MKPTGQQFPNLPPADSENRAVVEIPRTSILLSRGLTARISPEDFDLVSRHRWFAVPRNGGTPGFYAATKVRRGARRVTLYMHRLVAGDPAGLEVDHQNGLTLDNRRENLRACTHQQNMGGVSRHRGKSSSGFTGVQGRNGRYVGVVHLSNRTHRTPSFSCPVLAAVARDVLAKSIHGEFARLNFTFTPLSAA